MSRPSDWWVLDLDADPTPGDPSRVRELAAKFSGLSSDAFDAAAEVRRLVGGNAVGAWVGDSGAKFAEAVGELPDELDKLETSYGIVGRALTTWAGELESAQTQADGALSRGRAARERLDTARAQVAGAQAEVSSTQTALDAATGTSPLTTVPASWSASPPPPPDPAAVTTATTNHTAAVDHLGVLNIQVTDAQDDVDAERRLALSAKTLREEAARTCKREIDRASDAGIHNRSWLDKATDFVSDAWDVAVRISKVVVVVAGIAALVVGGPVAWIALAAAAVVLVDTLSRYADGEASLWDVGLAMLECIPGTKGLTTAAGLLRGFRSAGAALRGGLRLGDLARGGAALSRVALDGGRQLLGRLAGNVRAAGAWTTTVVRGLPGALGDAVHTTSAALPGGGSLPTGFGVDSKPFGDLLSMASDSAGAARSGGVPSLPASTVDDLADRASQIRAGSDVGKRRNISTVDSLIDGEFRQLDAVSGEASRPGMIDAPESPQFEPFHPPDTFRPTDAEYKILEDIASRIGPGSVGEVVIYTERAPCPACANVIRQFQERFPGVRVDVHSGGVT